MDELDKRYKKLEKTFIDILRSLGAETNSAEENQLLKVQSAFETNKVENNATKNTTKNSGVKYSLSKDARSEVENVLNDKNYSDYVKLADTTPSILLSQKGVKNLPMLMKPSHIRENILSEEEAKSKGLRVDGKINYHGLGKDLFLKVIDDLDNVTEAYRGTKNADNSVRRENYFLLISKQTDADGNVTNVPVFINEKGTYHRVDIDTNKVATIFGRYELKEYIKREIQKGNLVKIKNRSHLITSDSTTPIVAQYGKNASMWEKSSSSNPAIKVAQYETDNSNSSIPQNTDSVNRENEEISKNVDSDIKKSLKDTSSIETRESIAEAFKSLATTDGEKKIVKDYAKSIEKMDKSFEKKKDLFLKLQELKGKTDSESKAQREKYAAEIQKINDDIVKADESLLKIAAAEPFRSVVRKYQTESYKKGYGKGFDARDGYILKTVAKAKKRILNQCVIAKANLYFLQN